MKTDTSQIVWIPVKDVGDVRLGKQINPQKTALGHPHDYLRVANVLAGRIDYSDVHSMGFTASERETYGLRPGDILLNEGQSLELVGRSAVYENEPGRYFFQNTLIRFRSGPMILPAYAQIVFDWWRRTGVFASIAKQTTSIAHLGADRFANLRFPLRSLAGQHRIVAAVGAVHEAEQCAQRELEKLERLNHGVLGDVLEQYSVPDLSGSLWARVGEIFEVRAGFTLGPLRSPVRSRCPYLRVANVQRGRLDLSDVSFVEKMPGDEGRFSVAQDDLLIVEGHANPDAIGRCARASSEAAGYLYQNHLFRLRSEMVSSLSAEVILNSPRVRAYWRAASATSSGLYTINRAALCALPFPLIASDEELRLAGVISRAKEGESALAEEITKLARVKQAVVSESLGVDFS